MRDADEQAYVEYVAARMPWMRKVAFLLCHDWDRADDVCQTTLTNLYVGWRRACAADNLDGYVRTMIVRAFLGERRTSWFTRVKLLDSVRDEDVEQMAVGGMAARDDIDERMMVRSALAVVSPRQRATLVLRFYCDLSVEETAAALRCSTGTVKSQTARGLAALRRVIDTQRITVEG